MSQEGYEIRHIVLGAGKIGADDLADAQWADLPHARILHTASIDEMTSMLASCTALVTMKFHGAVVATMYGIPSFSFVAPGKPLSAKRVNFMRRIDRLDLVAPMSSLECVRALTGARRIDPTSVDMLRESSRTCISALRDEMRTVLLRR
ncbi:MAG: polysaccharide pyruvyl transferase family protein [Actinobacteria bacterium]|nr:polysaccharide pyruvyl transferase family protein [Actinomycetota bacterium]